MPEYLFCLEWQTACDEWEAPVDQGQPPSLTRKIHTPLVTNGPCASLDDRFETYYIDSDPDEPMEFYGTAEDAMNVLWKETEKVAA